MERRARHIRLDKVGSNLSANWRWVTAANRSSVKCSAYSACCQAPGRHLCSAYTHAQRERRHAWGRSSMARANCMYTMHVNSRTCLVSFQSTRSSCRAPLFIFFLTQSRKWICGCGQLACFWDMLWQLKCIWYVQYRIRIINLFGKCNRKNL